MRFTRLLTASATGIVTITMMTAAVSANYSVDTATGKQTWDFGEYTEKVSATQDPKQTTYASIDDYHGLNIVLAVNNTADYVLAGTGVVFGGKVSFTNTTGNNGRYIKYTPDVSGTLYVTGTSSRDKYRWGINDESENGGLPTKVDFVDNNSTSTVTSEATVNKVCEAGKSYYIYGKDLGATISKVEFVPDVTKADEYEPTEYKGSDKGYTASFTSGIASGSSINWYAWDANAFGKIAGYTIDTDISEGTETVIGLVVENGSELSDVSYGASVTAAE
jgi:hypothetical protein